MLALNTPLNPTGTVMDTAVLEGICHALVEENVHRKTRGDRPVFLLFDQVYWSLEFGRMEPVAPAGLVPECAPYVVMLDAISKSLAATGMRVGWSVAAPAVTQRMSDLLGHVGAWAPKAEQVATAKFLDDAVAFREFRLEMHRRLSQRLDLTYQGLAALGARGLPVEAIAPGGTLYLAAHFDLFGYQVDGHELKTNEDIRKLLLQRAGVAVVPFQAFGLVREDGWFRMSVGGATVPAIEAGLARLGKLFEELTA
jgi:aspartate aminotransferase